jgi:membrane-bound ClpP family serine protease
MPTTGFVSAFKMERVAYMATTLLAVAFLLVVASILIFKESYALALGTFGASGVITFSIGRLLQMWNQMVRVIFQDQEEWRR